MKKFQSTRFVLPEEEIAIARQLADSSGIVSLDLLVEALTPEQMPQFLGSLRTYIEDVPDIETWDDPLILVEADALTIYRSCS